MDDSVSMGGRRPSWDDFLGIHSASSLKLDRIGLKVRTPLIIEVLGYEVVDEFPCRYACFRICCFEYGNDAIFRAVHRNGGAWDAPGIGYSRSL